MENVNFYPNNLDEIKKIATLRGGICLSTKYLGAHEELDFKCAKNHTWSATPDSIKNANSWCSECASIKMKENTLNKLKSIVKQKQGKFNKNDFVRSDIKMFFGCKEGHKFPMRPSSVIGGEWCKECGIISAANKNRLSLKEISDLAHSFNCSLLSRKYTNSKQTLDWKCSNEHYWSASLDTMKSRVNRGNYFCKKCKNKK